MCKFNLAFKARHRAAFALIAVGLTCPVFGWAQESHNRELPLVWVLSTGGTIAGRGASSTSLTEYKAGSILGEELVSAVPEINIRFFKTGHWLLGMGHDRATSVQSAIGDAIFQITGKRFRDLPYGSHDLSWT